MELKAMVLAAAALLALLAFASAGTLTADVIIHDVPVVQIASNESVAYYLKVLNAGVVGIAPVTTPTSSAPTGIAGTSVLPQQPLLTAACIDKILSDSHSLAAGKGSVFASNAQKYNVDPAVALAFFRKESSLFNTTRSETAHTIGCNNKSIGNIRCNTSSCDKGFNKYDTWEAGIEAWFAKIAGETYVGAKESLDTIEKIVPVYAPPTENDTTLYISQTKQWTEEYRAYAGKTC